ncbi:MAG: phenylalanine--tRNA ligase subunit beta [Ectothiorhodospiraceae bacterium]|nr:phenylalanine--tRNA ligase subunit beta [Ectothiorhodospiraceae bacterium]
MRISIEWLNELLPVNEAPKQLADRLTMAGLEVDAVEPAAPPFSGVVVAEIISCEPHPDADKLQVCQVDTGSETVQIVCGAPNARVGLKAPLAVVGGELPGNFRIKKAKLRGVESFGMLCSARELGMAEDASGLMELPGSAPVGEDLRAYLQLSDSVVDVDLTPNRGDCLGMVGIAREVSALTGELFEFQAPPTVAAVHQDKLPIALEAPPACPRYVGRIIRGVNARAETPLWMRERLRRAGVRSLGPVVDATNYVMLELGQPMHAFDLARIRGGIRVRQAVAGETLELLNGETVTLDEETLVIADHEAPVAMAGIMGGEQSAVTDATTDILLESAFFSPLAISGKARRYGLHTDSSHRFERGVDPQIQALAAERATRLILEIAGGDPGPLIEAAEAGELPASRTVTLRQERIRQLLGIDIEPAEVRGILERLGLGVQGEQSPWTITVPPYRFDITLEVDLIEELARVHGYDRIPVRHPATPVTVRPYTEASVPLDRVRQALVQRGYQEAVTYSFVEPRLQELLDPDHVPVPLANPLSADMAVMRTSLWPGLIKAMQHNRNRQVHRIRLFETGLRFRGSDLSRLEQRPMLAAAITGEALPEQWGVSGRPADFFDLKGDLEACLRLSGNASAFGFVADRHPALHPGQTARIDVNGQPVGWIGSLHPALYEALELDAPVLLFELALDAVQEAVIPGFSPLSRYPSIRRDLAVVVDQRVSHAQVKACVRQAAGELLKDLVLFDVYAGKGISESARSLGIGLILQDFSRTLNDSETEELINRVIERLRQDLGAQLRGE